MEMIEMEYRFVNGGPEWKINDAWVPMPYGTARTVLERVTQLGVLALQDENIAALLESIRLAKETHQLRLHSVRETARKEQREVIREALIDAWEEGHSDHIDVSALNAFLVEQGMDPYKSTVKGTVELTATVSVDVEDVEFTDDETEMRIRIYDAAMQAIAHGWDSVDYDRANMTWEVS